MNGVYFKSQWCEMYKYKHSVYVDKKMWWINTADFQQQIYLLL